MSEDADRLTIRELGLDEIEAGGVLHGPFRRLHEAWTARGVSRWLELLERDGPHPTVVFGALLRGRLVGAVIGLWAPEPLEHFDDLFGHSYGRTWERPDQGAWHLVAVTTDTSPELRGLGLGRELLGCVLAWAAGQGFEVVRTLSPAVGLHQLAALWPRDTRDAIVTSARADGQPYLPVLRLHLGGGAVLERVLTQSRADDEASDRVTLRFLYATSPVIRRERRETWRRWCETRAYAIASGQGQPIADDLFRVESPHDLDIIWP